MPYAAKRWLSAAAVLAGIALIAPAAADPIISWMHLRKTFAQQIGANPSAPCNPEHAVVIVVTAGADQGKVWYCETAGGNWSYVGRITAGGGGSFSCAVESPGVNCTAGGFVCDDGAGPVYACNGLASAENYSQSFSSQTTVTLAHGLGTRNLIVKCYDSLDHIVEWDRVSIAGSPPYDATVTFFVPQSGRCVVGGHGG